jgi:protoheme IX farnesyltransferase
VAERLGGRAASQARRYAGLAWWVAGASLVLTLSGSALAPAVAGPRLAAIGGLPSNGGSALLVAGLLISGLAWQTLRQRQGDRLLLGGVGLALALLVAEGVLLVSGTPAAPVIVGALLWSATLALAVLALRRPLPAQGALPSAKPAERGPSLLSDYLSLTKPKVISLLLVTTLAAMFITEQGSPSGWLVFWTMLGGYLAAGGAGAINCAFDSDIDINMGRTSRRPVPSGRISRQNAMRFGLALSALSALVMLIFTTPLAMLLSTLGILYYAVFYTRWLKRSTWQNIVIGGGAGSLPPLVGWTAVTGTLSLPAILLFAIIFYWTPPHFWALALVKEKDYARAGVPMLPVVAGVHETRYQILIYSVILVALSTLLTPLGAMGWIYLVAALLFGARFLYDAWNVYRHGEQAHIWSLYKYSLLYLALLFAAMVVDRAVL